MLGRENRGETGYSFKKTLIKTLLLLTLITLLTWYSKQTRNNPFTPVESILIKNTGGNTSFIFRKSMSENRTEDIAVFFPAQETSQHSENTTTLNTLPQRIIVENESLFSIQQQNISDTHIVNIMNVSSDSLYELYNSMENIVLHDKSLRMKKGPNINIAEPFKESDKTCCVINYGDMSVMVLSGVYSSLLLKEYYREFFDVLVMMDISPELVGGVYSQVRPLTGFVTADTCPDISGIENLMLIPRSGSYEVRRGGDRDIKAQAYN